MDFKADFYIGCYDNSFPNGEAYTAAEFYEDLRCYSSLNVYMVLFGGGFNPLQIAVIAEHDGGAIEAALELIQARIQAGLYDYDGDPFEEENINVWDVRKKFFGQGNMADIVMAIVHLLGGEDNFRAATDIGLAIYPDRNVERLYRSYGIGSNGIEIKMLRSILLTYADFLSQLCDSCIEQDGMEVVAGKLILVSGPLLGHMKNTVLR